MKYLNPKEATNVHFNNISNELSSNEISVHLCFSLGQGRPNKVMLQVSLKLVELSYGLQVNFIIGLHSQAKAC